MDRQTESGYALVAVLLTVGILLAITALGSSQLKMAVRVSRLDSEGVKNYYQAVSGMNEVWAYTLENTDPNQIISISGCSAPDRPPPDEATYTRETDGFRFTAWVYLVSDIICPPAQGPPASKQDCQYCNFKPTDKEYYHFAFSWVYQGNETKLSPVSTQRLTSAERSAKLAPAYRKPHLVPRDMAMPAAASGYNVYVAATDSTTPPEVGGELDPSQFFLLVDGSFGNVVPCPDPRVGPYMCLKRPPSEANGDTTAPASPDVPGAYVLIARGWEGDPQSPRSDRWVRGVIDEGAVTAHQSDPVNQPPPPITYDHWW